MRKINLNKENFNMETFEGILKKFLDPNTAKKLVPLTKEEARMLAAIDTFLKMGYKTTDIYRAMLHEK